MLDVKSKLIIQTALRKDTGTSIGQCIPLTFKTYLRIDELPSGSTYLFLLNIRKARQLSWIDRFSWSLHCICEALLMHFSKEKYFQILDGETWSIVYLINYVYGSKCILVQMYIVYSGVPFMYSQNEHVTKTEKAY